MDSEKTKEKLGTYKGKYCGCSIWWLRLIEIVVFFILIGSIFGFAAIKGKGSTESTTSTQSGNPGYWENFVDFLPDTIGGFAGIIVGFFVESVLFNANKDRKQRRTLFLLLDEELSPVHDMLGDTASVSDEEILLKVISIPITVSVINSVENSALLDFKKNNLLDLLYNIFADYNFLTIAKSNYNLFTTKKETSDSEIKETSDSEIKETSDSEIKVRYKDFKNQIFDFVKRTRVQ